MGRPYTLTALAALAFALLHCASDPEGAVPVTPAPPAGVADAGGPPEVSPDASVDGGGTTTEPRTEGPGTRLTPQYVETELGDGTLVRDFQGFWDAKLAATCAVTPHVGGGLRCLPQGTSLDTSAPPEQVYKDAACTDVAALVAPGSAVTRIVVTDGSSCAPRAEVRNLGATSAAAQYYRRAGDRCELQGAVPAERVLRDLSAPLPASEFVAFQEVDESAPFPERTSGTALKIVAKRYLGEDGSFQSNAPTIRDGRVDASVTMAWDTTSTLRFLPAVAPSRDGDAFSDAACGSSLRTVYDACSSPLPLVSSYVTNPDRCSALRIFRRNAGAEVTKLYAGTPSSCFPTPTETNVRYFPSGSFEEVAPSSFSTATTTTVPALRPGNKRGTRIEQRAVVQTSGDGLLLRDRHNAILHDTKYDQRCLLFGKVVRCMPFTRQAYFLDAACTKVVATFTRAVPCDIGEKAATLFNLTPQRIVRRPTSAPLAAPLTLYRYAGAACVAATDVNPAAFDYHAIPDADLLPLEDSVAVVRRELVPAF